MKLKIRIKIIIEVKQINYDEKMFRRIKERNFYNKKNYRKEFQLKAYGTNNNHSDVYLDKVKEDIMNIRSNKIMKKNKLNKKKFVCQNPFIQMQTIKILILKHSS